MATIVGMGSEKGRVTLISSRPDIWRRRSLGTSSIAANEGAGQHATRPEATQEPGRVVLNSTPLILHYPPQY